MSGRMQVLRRILNTAWQLAFRGEPGLARYTAAQGAMISLHAHSDPGWGAGRAVGG